MKMNFKYLAVIVCVALIAAAIPAMALDIHVNPASVIRRDASGNILCPTCRGSGLCNRCGGCGMSYIGYSGQMGCCTQCAGLGSCNFCAGKGHISWMGGAEAWARENYELFLDWDED